MVFKCKNCGLVLKNKKIYRINIFKISPEKKYQRSGRNFIHTENYKFCKPCYIFTNKQLDSIFDVIIWKQLT